MRHATALAMMEAARAHAAEVGKPVAIAIVDAGGVLVGLDRLEGALPITAFLAEGKAAASALLGIDSGVLEAGVPTFQPIVDALVARFGGRFVAAKGAVTVLDDATVIGAVGVSGALADEDEAIARAAVAAWSL